MTDFSEQLLSLPITTQWDAAHPNGITATNIVYSDENLPQGSDLWLAWRDTMDGTATQACVVAFEPTDYKNAPKTWKDLHDGVGGELDARGQKAVDWGTEHEPLAREYFENEVMDGAQFDQVCIESRFSNNWKIGSSLDGYAFIDGEHHFVEIKCPIAKHNSKTAKMVIEDEIPDNYVWQMAHQALTLGVGGVTGHFFVFIPGGNEDGSDWYDWLTVPASLLTDRIMRLYTLWPMFAGGMIEPGDLRNMEATSPLMLAVNSWKEAVTAQSAAKKEAESARDKMVDLATQEAQVEGVKPEWLKRIYLDGASITHQQTVKTDYAKIVSSQLPKLDLSPWQTPSERWAPRQTATPKKS